MKILNYSIYLLMIMALHSASVTPLSADTTDVDLRLIGANSGALRIQQPDIIEPSYYLSGARTVQHIEVSGFSFLSAFEDVYPGIDVFHYADSHHFEYVFRLQNGADPAQIRLTLEDADIVGMTGRGDVIYQGDGYEAYQHDPVGFSEQQRDQPRRIVPARLSMAGESTTGVSVQDSFSRNADAFNGSRFNLVPAGGWLDGPDYDFYMSKYELSNDQFIEFLNDAQRHEKDPRGANMFFDENGNVWMNPEMQSQRDEMFVISNSKLRYDSGKPKGNRYFNEEDEDGLEPYKHHPVTGVSWYGSVKYCNWLTIHSGRNLAELSYTEGTNIVEWAPVTATNWTQGDFTAAEREAWISYKGFRLPMFRMYDDNVSETNAYNEFIKAASWNGYTNTTYGYGRDTFNLEDANTRPTAFSLEKSTLPVGYFDGYNTLTESKTRENENWHRLYDLTGNVSEWVNDPSNDGSPDTRSVVGGSYQEQTRALENDRIVVPYASESFCGIRMVTTFMPDDRTYLHVLYCFHTTNGLPPDIVNQFSVGGYGEPYAPGEMDGEGVLIPPDGMPVTREQPGAGEAEAPAGIYLTPEVVTDETGGGAGDEEGGGVIVYSNVLLAVSSENPSSGVNIQVTPSDITGQSSGNTAFNRTYSYGEQVTLTAPSAVGNNVFKHWLKDGVIYSTDTTVSITMYNYTQMTAVYENTVQLDVKSENPGSGVPITVSETDINGSSHGYTAFDRTYMIGETVTLTAPDLPNKTFVGWERNGSLVTTDHSVSVFMTSDTEMTAIYEDATKNLHVRSQNPGSGVNISVSVPDINGQASGSTPFDRVYPTGQAVTLNAPPSTGNSGFLHWLVNGIPYSTNPQLTITMNDDITVTAVYFETPEHTLNVHSINPNSGVNIDVSTIDNNGNDDGDTSFSRIYYEGTNVTVTAPASQGGIPFRGWLQGSQLMTTNTSYSVTMWSDITLTAWYEDVQQEERVLNVDSQNPGGGVPITVDQVDNDGEQNGDTSFQREYNFGTPVQLSVPPMAGTNVFIHWLRDGIPFSTNQTVNVEMITDVQMTVVFEPPIPIAVLTVKSDDPDSGVHIDVSAPDKNGDSDGDTTFERIYDVGVSTVLTAPTNAGGNVFIRWMMNGTPVSTNPVIQVEMLEDTEMIAVYRPEEPPPPDWTLTVESQPNSGVNVDLSQPDENGDSDGSTTFTRIYEDGNGTSLTAPQTAGGLVFSQWLLDGSPLTTNLTTTITMYADHTLTALYVDPLGLHKLTVNSLNPNGGVPVTCSIDFYTNGNGVTTFERFYEDGDNVNLTALPSPPGDPGNTFKQWLMDGVPYSTNLNVSIDMYSDVNMTVQYGPAPPEENRTLTIESINPASGVPIVVVPNDLNGDSDGSTSFQRIYSNGMPVSVTAPDMAGGNVFSHWLREGTQVTTNYTIGVEMLSDLTLTAVYETPLVLTVNSENPGSGVGITVSATDIFGGTDGTTTFERRYLEGEAVTLTAPPVADGNVFLYWEKDGNPITTNNVIDVTMLTDIELTAVYADTHNLTVKSVNPDSGVSIGVSEPDVNSDTAGNTLFVREYLDGTTTTLTAPVTNFEGNVFTEWLRDGQSYSTDPVVDITMLSDVEMTAVYGTPLNEYWLTVKSEPDDNVHILVTPVDNKAESDGDTTFARLYDEGTIVDVTAPPMSSTNVFQQWLLDGSPYSTNQHVTVEMLANHELLAVFGPPQPGGEYRTLLVDSENPDGDVPILVSNPDVDNRTDGDTTFVRNYEYGEITTLTAPAIGGTNGNTFVGWYRDGMLISDQLSVDVNMIADIHMTAVYESIPDPVTLTVESQNPDSGVHISISPIDNNSEAGGDTTFTRLYDYATEVTLAAPTTVGTNVFSYWLWNNSVIWSTNENTDVTLFNDTTMTAVFNADNPFTNEVVLTVLAENPDGAASVSIDVTPLDNSGDGTGVTDFQREYDGGTEVTLTAPQNADGYIFDHWELNGSEVSSELSITTPPLTDGQTYTAVYEIEEHESGL